MTNIQAPLISVVVPTYKRPDLLQRCLSALLVQSLARDAFEIIVCDDGPSAQAKAVAMQAAQRGNGRPNVRYLEVRDTQGPAGARNLGWRNAAADVIAFTDDDTVPEPGWLQAGLDGMASGVQAAVGQIVMPLPPRASDYQRDAARLCQAEFATANCFVRRDVLEAVQGFDERYTQAWREDSDLHFSLIQRGFSVAPIPGAIVIHPLRPARFAAGLGMQKKVMFDVLLYRKYPALYRERIRSGPPWFYLGVTLALLLGIIGFLAGEADFGAVALWVWVVMTMGFFIRRLWVSAFTLRNIGELLLTSILIPPLSVFWRAVGAARFGWALP
jgi:GT2 family glycosyltransferase